MRALSLTMDVGAIGLAAVMLHFLLLKRYLDRPAVIGGCLVAVFAVVVGAVWLARKTPAPDRGRRQVLWARVTPSGLALLAFFLLQAFIFHLAFDRASSDGREYFVQVRSMVMDRDLDFANENATFGVRGTAGQYPIGSAILWIPFFLVAHAWLQALNLLGADYPLDGFFNPYQRAVGLGTLLYGSLALYLIFRLLRRHFTARLSALTVIVLAAGSFVTWYLAVESTMSHGTSLFATTAFLAYWLHTSGRRDARRWAMLGVLGGLMSLTRFQNALFLVVPLGEALVDYGRSVRRQAWGGAGRLFAHHLLFTIVVAAAFMPQVLFWRARAIDTVGGAAQQFGVKWTSPSFLDVLFSSNHGLFSWTPVVYLAVLGLPLFMRRNRLVGSLFVLAFLAQLYINSVVVGVGGGTGFGARRFANCTLIFAFGLACALEWLARRPRLLVGAALLMIVGLNAIFMRDVYQLTHPRGGGVTFDRIVEGVYRRLGNPFAFPGNVVFAWRHGVTLRLYDEVNVHSYTSLQIDVGAPGDERFLNRGWSIRERAPDGSFRWAIGEQSDLMVGLWDREPYRIEFRCVPFFAPELPPQVIEVWVNDQLVDRVVLRPFFDDYVVRVPAAMITQNATHVRFGYRRANSPRSLGRGTDDRPLAVRFQHLGFVLDR